MMHEDFMRRALDLATRGQGRVGNGALVGAVLVRNGNIIADGYYTAFGESHAERMLLELFKEQIQPDDVLYVNLEPCAHTGKTPPCVDIILERGIKHVVFGMKDPDTRVAGKGIVILQNAGVEVIGPICRAESERLNRGFISVRAKNRPWITLKRAQNSSGKISHADGSPLKITSPAQDAWSHTYLRMKHDAVLVGVQTIINDDPLLNTRFAQNLPQDREKYQPYKIILDPQFRVPLGTKVMTDQPEKTIVITAPNSSNEKKVESEKSGIRIFEISLNESFDFDELWKKLLTPAKDWNGLTSILVEGGERTWKNFRDAGLVDEDIILIGK